MYGLCTPANVNRHHYASGKRTTLAGLESTQRAAFLEGMYKPRIYANRVIINGKRRRSLWEVSMARPKLRREKHQDIIVARLSAAWLTYAREGIQLTSSFLSPLSIDFPTLGRELLISVILNIKLILNLNLTITSRWIIIFCENVGLKWKVINIENLFFLGDNGYFFTFEKYILFICVRCTGYEQYKIL